MFTPYIPSSTPDRAAPSSVRLRVPASTANLGPGFDALGLALTLYNTVVLEPADAWDVDGERDERRLAAHPAYRGARRALAWLDASGARVAEGWRALSIRQSNAIPVGRGGLGNSATAVVAGLAGAARLAGLPIPEAELVDLATEVEGHPDNAAAAILGGLVVAVRTEHGVLARRLPMPNPPRVVLAIPALEVRTERARERLPARLGFDDAAFTVGRACLLVAALTSGDHALLRTAMQDRLHTPHRAHLVPGLDEALAGACEAGALGAALSGSGPSVLAFVPPDAPAVESAVAAALTAPFERRGLACAVEIVDVDREGLRLLT